MSDRLVEKGRLKIFGCGPAGRQAIVRLDRAASAANAAFDDLERGDVATIANARVATDGLRIGEDMDVVDSKTTVVTAGA